jgi:predicted RNA binding protein YcfA (HicA-like mRNA interferase family)
MTKLPSLSSKEVIKALRSVGFENAPKRGKGSHIALVKKETEQTLLVIIPRKKVIPKGTLNAILQQAALTREEFLSLLKAK